MEQVEVRTLRPGSRFDFCGYVVEVERQARRTTFARVVGGQLRGTRIQLSNRALVWQRKPTTKGAE